VLIVLVNVAILGTVGYFSYKHWSQPWDRRTVSAVTVGLLGLSGLEG
jgi:Tfp pilus assembly protein PilE